MNSYNINKNNNEHILRMIEKKNSTVPYFATVNDVKSVLTDMDQFPYTRWFRGVPNVTVPIVAEREAGYRPRHDICYEYHMNKSEVKGVQQRLIFEAPCSTVFPKFKENDDKINDITLNKQCIIEYR